jgi:predicted GNAT family acetyltransferase
LNPLDRPVWASLTGAHAHLAQGAGPARRYRPQIHHFLGWADDSPATLAAAAALVAPGEQVYAGQSAPIPDVPGRAAVVRRPGVQMRYAGGMPPADGASEIAELAAADSAEMLALARLTEPGPFETETWRMGRFFGVRRAGRLVAMAGQRLHPPGHVELSGVCTHPDCRGEGLATRLTNHVTRAILEHGETPFLHAWKDNTGAIALYERLGYLIRREVNVAVFERAKG